MIRKFLTVTAAAITLSACSLAPELKMPETNIPAAFKETGPVADGQWKLGAPAEHADRGEWWKSFKDDGLNAMEEAALTANQSLKAAAARVEQARAIAGITDSDLLPHVEIGANANRGVTSEATLGKAPGTGPGPVTNTFRATGTISYEADLFGRVRDSSRASGAEAEAAEATYKSVLLALQADVAEHYFTLRSLKAEHVLLKDTLASRAENTRIIKKRVDAGDAGEQDLARAETDYSLVNADMLDVERRMLETEHAMAVLLGKAPAEFAPDVKNLDGVPPVIPASVPSSVLERRPDITVAQKNLAAANAKIGVAKAAFFPRIFLTASDGYESNQLEDLFKWSSRAWTLGPLQGTALTLPVFERGRNKAGLALATAKYDETVALYRQQVLVAFKEVEDSLTQTRLYRAQAATQAKAVESARKASHISDLQYKEGYVPYTDVVDTQRTALAAERANLQVKLAQYVSTIRLIRAIGGDWDAPKPEPATTPVPLKNDKT